MDFFAFQEKQYKKNDDESSLEHVQIMQKSWKQISIH